MNCVLKSIKTARQYSEPWLHYEIDNLLDSDLHNYILTYPFPSNETIEQFPDKYCLLRKFDRIKALAHKKQYTRTLNDNRHSCEINFSKTIREESAKAKKLFNLFTDPDLLQYLEQIGNITLKGSYLRVQLIKDLEGYSIRPHTDIQKKFTLLGHFCTETEQNLGTDLYCQEGKKIVKTTTFGENAGMFFFPSSNTWHGYVAKPLNKQRVSLMVNYFINYPKENNILDNDGTYYAL